MTTEDFSILSLSPEIFEERIPEEKVLNLDELFEYLQCPEEARKSFLDTTTFPRLRISVGLTSKPSIAIRSPTLDIIWKFYGKRSPKRLLYSELEKRSVEVPDFDSGSNKTLVFHVKRPDKVVGFHDSIEDVILLIKHLLELPNSSINYLVIDPHDLDHLETILSIEKFKKADQVTIDSGIVSHEKMRRVLEDFEPESLRVHCSPEPGFEFNGTLSQCYIRHEQGEWNCSEIYLGNNTSWFRVSMLQTMRCSNFNLKTRTITNEDLNQFLHLWFNGATMNPMEIFIEKARFPPKNKVEEKTQFYDDYCWNDNENWKRVEFKLQKIIKGLESCKLPNCNWHHAILQRETDGMKMRVNVSSYRTDQTDCDLKSYF